MWYFTEKHEHMVAFVSWLIVSSQQSQYNLSTFCSNSFIDLSETQLSPGYPITCLIIINFHVCVDIEPSPCHMSVKIAGKSRNNHLPDGGGAFCAIETLAASKRFPAGWTGRIKSLPGNSGSPTRASNFSYSPASVRDVLPVLSSPYSRLSFTFYKDDLTYACLSY